MNATATTPTLEKDLAARLKHAVKTARMWGSPEELEAAGRHFAHVWLATRTPGWRFEQTHALWRALGGPFADDADEHAVMRSRMWAEREADARVQVVSGYLVVWTGLERHPVREAAVGPWLEHLLDFPEEAGTPDLLNMVLFSLMGFVAASPQAYVEALAAERERVGGHPLRPFHIVGARGPSDAGLTYTRNFTTWDRVASGLSQVLAQLESPARA